MRATFGVPELIKVFRAGLTALIPVAEQARIAWREPDVYDPWESIEQALFASIVASVVDNAAPARLRPLPKYGATCSSYADLSFITERAARLRGERLVFLQLTTVQDPFDTMRLLDVGAGFVPTGRTVEVPLLQSLPELAARAVGELRYCEVIEYEE
jgi:hypothetical protein